MVYQSEFKKVSSDIVRSDFNYVDISEVGASFLRGEKWANCSKTKKVAFRPGLPPLDIFPILKWKKLSNQYWQFIRSSELTYDFDSGVQVLRDTLVSYLRLNRNIKCDASQVFVVGGSVQSLYLISNILLNPGDAVGVEEPTFPNVISIIKGMRANLVCSQEVSNTEKQETKNCKFIHVSPNCQYPIGKRMTISQRLDLCERANKMGSFIIENDYEHEINNRRESIPTIFDLDQQGRTIYLGTFNRVLHPSIRIGYMIVPKVLIEPMSALLSSSHRFVSPTIQHKLNSFIDRKHFQKHIRNVLVVSEDRNKMFVQLFEKYLSFCMTILYASSASLHMCAKFNRKMNDVKICEILEVNGISIHPLSQCYSQKEKQYGLIMGYACVEKSKMEKVFIKIQSTFREVGL